MLVKLTWNFIGSAPGSLLYPNNAGTQLGEEEHPRLSNSVGDLHVYMHISTLSVGQVNNCMYTSNFGPSHHQSGLPKPKCDRLKWCKAGFWSAWPVAHCLKDTQALLCMGHIDRGQLSSSLCHGPSQNCMSMIIMYVNSLQHGPLTKPLLKRNLEH